jgi:hypothetical protein
MTHFVDKQPGLLKQVIGISPTGKLADKEPVQLRAQLLNQHGGRAEVATLISSHQYFQIAVWRHGAVNPQTSSITMRPNRSVTISSPTIDTPFGNDSLQNVQKLRCLHPFRNLCRRQRLFICDRNFLLFSCEYPISEPAPPPAFPNVFTGAETPPIQRRSK